MAQTVKLKRSSVAEKVPTASDMELGELAMNTADGKIYFDGIDLTDPVMNTPDAFVLYSGILEFGRFDGGSHYFSGGLDDIRIWNILRTQQQIQDNMNHQLSLITF